MDSEDSDEEFLSADEGEDDDVSLATAPIENVVVEKVEENVSSVENTKLESEILSAGENNQEHGNVVAEDDDVKRGEEKVAEENTADEGENSEILVRLNEVHVAAISDESVEAMVQQPPTQAGEDNQGNQQGNVMAVRENEKKGDEKVSEENAEGGEGMVKTPTQHGENLVNVADAPCDESTESDGDKSVPKMDQPVPIPGELVSPSDEEPCGNDVGIEEELASLVAVEKGDDVEKNTESHLVRVYSGDKEDAIKRMENVTTSSSQDSDHDHVDDQTSSPGSAVDQVGWQSEDISLDKLNIDEKDNSGRLSSDCLEMETDDGHTAEDIEIVDEEFSAELPAESYPMQTEIDSVDKTLPLEPPAELNESAEPCVVVEQDSDKCNQDAALVGVKENGSSQLDMNSVSENYACGEESANPSAANNAPAKDTDESWDWLDNAEAFAVKSSHKSQPGGQPIAMTEGNDNVSMNNISTSNVKPHDEASKPASKPESSVRSTNKTTNDSWGWDSWADNFISQATSKVSTLMETVEGQLGIPDPTMVAQKLKEEREKENNEMDDVGDVNMGGKDKQLKENKEQEKDGSHSSTASSSSWFSSYIPVASTLTNLVQNKGQELMTGGIDALEFIGKSTVNYLSEGDPGLRNKRKALMRRNKGETLSQVLQQAKLKADERQLSDSPPKGEDPKKLSDMLEKFQGIAHLDALQMLSNNSEAKLVRISKVQSDEAREDCSILRTEIKQNFELSEEEESHDNETDFKKDIFAANKMLKMKVTCSKLLNSWSKLKKKYENLGPDNSDECFEICISSLAEFVSRCVEYHRKVADMLIVTDIEAREMAVNRAQVLKSLTEMFRSEASMIANTFANHLANNKEDKIVSDFITDIYLENENCSSLLSDSHALLLPILQWSAIQ